MRGTAPPSGEVFRPGHDSQRAGRDKPSGRVVAGSPIAPLTWGWVRKRAVERSQPRTSVSRRSAPRRSTSRRSAPRRSAAIEQRAAERPAAVVAGRAVGRRGRRACGPARRATAVVRVRWPRPGGGPPARAGRRRRRGAGSRGWRRRGCSISARTTSAAGSGERRATSTRWTSIPWSWRITVSTAAISARLSAHATTSRRRRPGRPAGRRRSTRRPCTRATRPRAGSRGCGSCRR